MKLETAIHLLTNRRSALDRSPLPVGVEASVITGNHAIDLRRHRLSKPTVEAELIKHDMVLVHDYGPWWFAEYRVEKAGGSA